MRVTPARRTRALTLGVATALLVAACSGRGADVPPLASTPASKPVAVGSVAPSAAASPATAAPSAPPAATPAPSPTKAPGTGKIVDKADGFAITLAAGWREIPLDGSETADVDATLHVEDSVEALSLKEFFLVLSSTGLAFRRCELQSVNGEEIAVSFIGRRNKRAAKKDEQAA